MDELRELIALLRDNDLSEFELEREGFRVRLRRGVDFEGRNAASDSATSGSVQAAAVPPPGPQSASGSVAGSPAAGASVKGPANEDQDLQIIPSPIVGTFYRSRSPHADPFVTVGSQLEPDSVVCIIEAMKLMNEIQAEATGVVAKIYVENGQPVEYGQPLFGIRS